MASHVEFENYLLLPQALLEVVNDLFEEQTDLEKIVRKIMQRALTLLQCERCSVLLLEDIESPVRPFEMKPFWIFFRFYFKEVFASL